MNQTAFSSLVEAEEIQARCSFAGTVSEVREALHSQKFDAVVSDYQFNGGTVLDVLDMSSNIPVIVVASNGNEGIAVKTMKAGAYDYLIKDTELNYMKVLPLAIKAAIKHKASEDRLRLLESAISSANDAIIILEAEPEEMLGRRILYVNEAFTKMTGYSFNEATSKTLRMLRGPETSLAALNKIRHALEECRPVRVELVNYCKDGSQFWAECNIVPFADEQGVFSHWVSVQRDITERKQAEQERERLIKEIESINADLTELNQELETIGAERTMSLMALTVADRIRNPAAMIGGRCRRIMAREDLSQDLRENIQYILEGADNLDKIVKDFETFLKSRKSLFKQADINTLIESVVKVSGKEAELKGIEMTVLLSQEPLCFNMQKDLLKVAVFHIMKNSIEATSKGGKVTVETSREEDNIVLKVTDTGYGIPLSDVGNVFRPFFSTKERGFGLGLPLVKQIINEHLGEVIIKSKPGQGSTFLVRFPVRWKEDNLY